MKFSWYGLGIAKGMMVTISHLFRHPITVQYPEEQLNHSRRTRGTELIWSQKRCTGCCTCAKACPIGAIKIITSTNPVVKRYQVETYQVDNGYCIQCGLCVEACPFDALYMSMEYEGAAYRRNGLILQKEDMLETPGKPVSGYYYSERASKLPGQTLLVETSNRKK